MKLFFSELFEYNLSMNNELIKAMVRQQDMITDKSLELMSHILNAQQRWNSRILKDQPLIDSWHLHALDELAAINENHFQTSISIIQSFGLETVIEYPGSEDNTLKNPFRDMLFHIINHSTYHRGQIAMDFRQNGLKPIETDYDAWRDCMA
jgi:uncharacterized damage-inducible protein DinB